MMPSLRPSPRLLLIVAASLAVACGGEEEPAAAAAPAAATPPPAAPTPLVAGETEAEEEEDVVQARAPQAGADLPDAVHAPTPAAAAATAKPHAVSAARIARRALATAAFARQRKPQPYGHRAARSHNPGRVEL